MAWLSSSCSARSLRVKPASSPSCTVATGALSGEPVLGAEEAATSLAVSADGWEAGALFEGGTVEGSEDD